MSSYNSPFTGNVVQPTDVSYRSITLAANTQLEWPINGNATDDYAARIMDVTASSAGLSLFMPPANQTSVGNDAMIRNVGANTFTVKDFAGTNTIITIAAGEAKYIYITANPDTQGTWGNIAFGVGTSAADAATLAGSGLVASNATLNQSHPFASVTAGYTFLTTDRAKTMVWSGGATTATLPIAAATGNNWFFLFKNNGTGTATISPASGNIDGGASKAFAPGESAFIVSTGAEYVTVGYGVSTQFEFGVLTKPVVSGTYTLTASEAANTIQIYTGTLTGNVTVVVPPVANFYVLSNQCSAGAFTLTFTTGVLGSIPAVLPQGQATLICDATNLLNASTTFPGGVSVSLVSGTAGGPSLSFGLEPSTGIFRPGAGRFGVSVLGNQILDVETTGIEVTGTGYFSGGISGGTF
jgi:hypothetical protein